MTNFRSKMEAGEQSELKLYKHYPCILQQKKEMLHKRVSAKMYSRKNLWINRNRTGGNCRFQCTTSEPV